MWAVYCNHAASAPALPALLYSRAHAESANTLAIKFGMPAITIDVFLHVYNQRDQTWNTIVETTTQNHQRVLSALEVLTLSDEAAVLEIVVEVCPGPFEPSLPKRTMVMIGHVEEPGMNEGNFLNNIFHEHRACHALEDQCPNEMIRNWAQEISREHLELSNLRKHQLQLKKELSTIDAFVRNEMVKTIEEEGQIGTFALKPYFDHIRRVKGKCVAEQIKISDMDIVIHHKNHK